MKAMQAILRQVNRPKDSKLNILVCPTHEPFETVLCKTGHNFYAYRCEHVRDWNFQCRMPPDNYTLLPRDVLPLDLEIDLVMFQNIEGQVYTLTKFAREAHIPLIRFEHTLAYPEWSPALIHEYKMFSGDENIFITDYSRNSWMFSPDNSVVVGHAVDTDLFKPDPKAKKNGKILSVVNQWVARDRPCGYNLWRHITDGLPVLPVGDTPGLSEPTKTVEELVKYYQECDVFVNTSILSPMPMSLLEAMSCGCAIVSTATCGIPEYLVNGYNAYISNDPKTLRFYLEDLLKNPDRRRKFGENARTTIEKRCNIPDYVKRLNEVFYRAANLNVGAS